MLDVAPVCFSSDRPHLLCASIVVFVESKSVDIKQTWRSRKHGGHLLVTHVYAYLTGPPPLV